MANEPLVSVVIATYNMAHYLVESVDSVLRQKWDNLEIIVVDDGSTDDTSEVMKRFNADQRIRYIPTKNQGQSKAKNRGLEEARGDFIGFCDADDIWRPNKLKIQMPAFSDRKVGVVYSEVDYMNEDGKPIIKRQPYLRYSGSITNQLIIKNFIPFGTAIIRKKCLLEGGYFDEELSMGIDWDLWLRYSVRWDFKYVADHTYAYRIWPGQMSKNYRGRYESAFKILNNFLEKNGQNIPNKVVARAWADMYTSRAMSIAEAENSFYEPLKDILIGLKWDYRFFPGWRSLGKLILRRT